MRPLHPILILIVALFALTAEAQYPILRNFPHTTTGGGTQNWNVIQNQDGLVYLANSNGLMCYDGQRWTCTPNANYSDVRAICPDFANNRIFAGGSNELGYYDLSHPLASPRYVSLISTWPAKSGDIGEVWNIHALGDAFVFQGKKHLAVYREGAAKLRAIAMPAEVMASVIDQNRLVLLCTNGFYSFDGQTVKKMPGQLPQNILLVRDLLSTDYGLLLVIAEHGVYRYDGQTVTPFDLDITPFLTHNKVFSATAKGSTLAFGTIRNGLVVKDLKTGRCEYANVSTGLQNNTVLSVAFDHQGNVWMGLDNGVSYLMRDLPFMSLLGENLLIGRGYASLVDGQRLYLGTNQGLFVTAYPLVGSATPPAVAPIADITGQVWCLRKTSAGILCGSDQGTLRIIGDRAIPIPGPAGTWDFRELRRHPGIILGCDYNGFFTLRVTGPTLTYQGRLQGVDLSSVKFEEDADGTIWASHWQKGVYHLWLNDEGTRVVKQERFGLGNGLLVDVGNYVSKLQDTVLVASVDGFLRYDRTTHKLTHVHWLNDLINHYGTAVQLNETPSHDAWAMTGDNIKLLTHRPTGEYDADSTIFSGGANNVFTELGHIGFTDSTHTIFNANNGFYIASHDNRRVPASKQHVLIRRVTDLNGADSLYTLHKKGDNIMLVIPKQHNSIRVEFALPEYHSDGLVTYQCYLEGYDKQWGAEQPEPSKDYTQLPHGNYTLHVRAHNLYDGTTSETSLKLTVPPAWYETWWAWIIYTLLAAGGMLAVVRWFTRRQQRALQRIEDERNRQLKEQEMTFQIEKAQQEHEVMEARNTQLEHDLKHKTSELGDFTLNLMRKNDMLQHLDASLTELADGVKHDESKAKLAQRIKAIRKSILDNMNDDDNWDKFEENFNLVYDNFMAKLLTQFPDLNKNERKLCAYLRLGLSSKEIASLLNISLRSVETFRYRLRKKLGLEQRESMTDFFQQL